MLSDGLPPPVPKELMCPITQELMVDPVFAEDGFSYERVGRPTFIPPSLEAYRGESIHQTNSCFLHHGLAVNRITSFCYSPHGSGSQLY
jgi:hypothetical protein